MKIPEDVAHRWGALGDVEVILRDLKIGPAIAPEEGRLPGPDLSQDGRLGEAQANRFLLDGGHNRVRIRKASVELEHLHIGHASFLCPLGEVVVRAVDTKRDAERSESFLDELIEVGRDDLSDQPPASAVRDQRMVSVPLIVV